MRLTTTLAAAAALAVSAVSANAGGMSAPAMDAPVVMVEEPAPAAGSSISSTYIVVGIVAALVIAAVASED
jgi:hypothetical protein